MDTACVSACFLFFPRFVSFKVAFAFLIPTTHKETSYSKSSWRQENTCTLVLLLLFCFFGWFGSHFCFPEKTKTYPAVLNTSLSSLVPFLIFAGEWCFKSLRPQSSPQTSPALSVCVLLASVTSAGKEFHNLIMHCVERGLPFADFWTCSLVMSLRAPWCLFQRKRPAPHSWFDKLLMNG